MGLFSEMMDEASEKDREIARLRNALIEAGRASGAFLDDRVTTDFLMGVPKEVDLKIKRLRAEAESERSERAKLVDLLRKKDDAMGVLFDRMNKAGIDCSDLIS
jgi:hypothetical protein